jgi:pimeloyl-ACP methyl ester carboxylesterase
MFSMPDPELAAVAIAEFLTTPIDWYFHLALRTSEHARVSLSRISVPVVMVAATFDILAGTRHMMTAAERVQDGTYIELRGSHFIQMEQPERVHQLLLDFLARVHEEQVA